MRHNLKICVSLILSKVFHLRCNAFFPFLNGYIFGGILWKCMGKSIIIYILSIALALEIKFTRFDYFLRSVTYTCYDENIFCIYYIMI